MPKVRPQAKCHPDLPHFAFGFCKKCYIKDHYIRNRQHILDRTKKWAEANREKRRQYVRDYRSRSIAPPKCITFGISRKEWEDILLKQGGGCAICGATRSKTRGLCSDHNHTTGKFRGILCQTCNTGIGHLKDNPTLVRRALEYLEAN